MTNLFNWNKQNKNKEEIVDVDLNISTASFAVKYKNGDVINYSIIDIIKQLDLIEKQMNEKIAANIFFGVLAIVIGVIYFISTNLTSNLNLRAQVMYQNNSRLELVDTKLEEADKAIYQELRNIAKELEKENQLLRERMIMLEQKTS